MTQPMPGFEYGRGKPPPHGHEFSDVVSMPHVPPPTSDGPVVQVHMAEGLTLRPGDTLVIRLAGPLDEDEMAYVKDRLTELLPDHKVVVIVADGMVVATHELSDVVRRSERVRALALSRQEMAFSDTTGEPRGLVDSESIRPSEVLAILDGKD